MARLIEVKDLAARKRALLSQSEVYRQTLALDVQNLQLYAITMQHRLKRLRTIASIVTVAVPLARTLFRSRSLLQAAPAASVAKRGFFRTLLAGWRLYRKYGPIIQTFVPRR